MQIMILPMRTVNWDETWHIHSFCWHSHKSSHFHSRFIYSLLSGLSSLWLHARGYFRRCLCVTHRFRPVSSCAVECTLTQRLLNQFRARSEVRTLTTDRRTDRQNDMKWAIQYSMLAVGGFCNSVLLLFMFHSSALGWSILDAEMNTTHTHTHTESFACSCWMLIITIAH